jgi:hypothetical protein
MQDILPPVDEGMLARVWAEQLLLAPSLRTRSGQKVQVIYRGRWSGGPGPDFKGAVLWLGNCSLLKGDVEIHVHSSDWISHGHDRDPAYNSVALHVVLWDDTCLPPVRHNGADIETLPLEGSLAIPIEYISRLKAYPISALSDEPCWMYLAGVSDDDVLGLLDDLGDARFAGKVAQFEAAMSVEYPDQVLYEGVLDAMGYAINRKPFQMLANSMRFEYLDGLLGGRTQSDSCMLLESVMLGAAGLLPMQRDFSRHFDWETASYVDEIESTWLCWGANIGLETLHPGIWQTSSVRPLNHPVRRVVAAARLLCAYVGSGLVQYAMEALADPSSRRRDVPNKLAVGGRSDTYWERHYDFGLRMSRPADLLGADRRRDIAVNVALPFLAAYSATKGDDALERSCRQAYARYPACATNAHIKWMVGPVLGPRAQRVFLSARRQQALVHLYRQYCRDRQCLSCPVSSHFSRT